MKKFRKILLLVIGLSGICRGSAGQSPCSGHHKQICDLAAYQPRHDGQDTKKATCTDTYSPCYPNTETSSVIRSLPEIKDRALNNHTELYRDTSRNLPKVELLPNPFQDAEFNLYFGGCTEKKVSVMIFDLYGKQLYWRHFYQPAGLARIRTGLQKGIYSLVISSNAIHFAEEILVLK